MGTARCATVLSREFPRRTTRNFSYRRFHRFSNMFQTRSEYDRGVNTFSPEGRLFQVEYAIEAVKLGSTAIAIRTRFGIVLAVEKRITSPLMEAQSVDKIMEIDSHCAAAVSGFTADAKTMVEHG